jgi:crossover junction endonuclease MUS81
MQVKRLPVGDVIWIARHRKFLTEYVLDFIAERKNVSDLASSIRDNRYKDQKLRLQVLSLQQLAIINLESACTPSQFELLYIPCLSFFL